MKRLPKDLETKLREAVADKFYGVSDEVIDTILNEVDCSETVRIESHLPKDHVLHQRLMNRAYSDELKLLMAKCVVEDFDTHYVFVYDEHTRHVRFLTTVDVSYRIQYPTALGDDLNNYLEVSNVSLGFSRKSLLEEPEFQTLFVFYLQDHDMICAEDDITEEFIRCDDRAKRATFSALYELRSKYGMYSKETLCGDAVVFVEINE